MGTWAPLILQSRKCHRSPCFPRWQGQPLSSATGLGSGGGVHRDALQAGALENVLGGVVLRMQGEMQALI